MANERYIVEKALAPGNLVHGGRLDHLPSFSRRGIMTRLGLGLDIGERSRGICFALLGDQPLPRRYSEPQHHGPRATDKFSMAIIVSGPLLRPLCEGELLAIGDNFWNPKHSSRRGDYRIEEGEVYGIPIRPQNDFPEYQRRYEQEVRLTPADPKNTSVKENTWTGIIINRERLRVSKLTLFRAAQYLTHPIPLISENCELLSEDLRDITNL